jgi:hypothetical protein
MAVLTHFILALRSREQLREMHYDLSAGEALMLKNNVVTIVKKARELYWFQRIS